MMTSPSHQTLVWLSASWLPASSLAGRLLDGSRVRRIEDGPYGATPLTVGEELARGTITTPRSGDGESWGAVRLSDYSLAQTAYALAQSKLWLPGSAASVELKMAPLNHLGNLGTYHLDIIGPAPRGPFNKVAPSPTSTYPSLWNHNAQNETTIVCDSDSQLQVRQGMEEKAAHVWATASRSHLNLDFRFNSQPLAVAFAERHSLGGRAWPNVSFNDKQFDYAFAAWGNSTLALLCSWWRSNRQVAGRGTTTITAAPSLPMLDLSALSAEQLRTSEAIFNELRGKELKPAYLADADPNRALLDRRVVCDLLVLQRRFMEGWPVAGERRRGAWHGSAGPVRYYPESPPATAAVQRARTVPGAASPAPPGTLGAGLSGASFPPQACCRPSRKAPASRHRATW